MTKVLKILCFSAAVAVMAISFSGCNSMKWFNASAQENGAGKGPLPTAPEMPRSRTLDGKDVTLSKLERQSRRAEFLGHLVRTLPSGNPLDDRVAAEKCGQRFHDPRSRDGR